MRPDSCRQTRADAALVAVTIAWGATFTLVQAVVQQMPLLCFLALRFSLAAALLAVIFWRDMIRAGGRALRAGLAAGVCLFAAYVLQTAALRYTTASRAAFLTALCTVLVPLLSAAVYKTVPRAAEAAGVAMAFAGTAMMTLPATQASAGWNRGDLLAAGCAVAFAAHILVIGRAAPESGFAAISVVQLAVVALLAGLTAPLEPGSVRLTGPVVFAVVFTGLVCSALAFTVQAWAQQFTSATRAALIFALEPVAAAVTSYVVAGELLAGWPLAGAGLILAGVAAVELRR